MSENLAPVSELDEEDHGLSQLSGGDATEDTDRNRVSFSGLTSTMSSAAPPRLRPSSSLDHSLVSASSSTGSRSTRHFRGGLLPSFRRGESRRDQQDSGDLSSGTISENTSTSRPLNRAISTAVAATRLGRKTSSEMGSSPAEPSRVYRRYRVGDQVLVSNHGSRFANLVNRYGYPPGEGHTPEEQRGPYLYILAAVAKVHFEEDAQYYSVTRADTGMNQRADEEWMEPIRTARGEAAARRAATRFSSTGDDDQEHENDSKLARGPLFFIVEPILWLCDWFYHVILKKIYKGMQKCMGFLNRQAWLYLNGMRPYSFSAQCTMVNFLVFCSFWFVFMDHARLAFFKPSADFALAIIDLIVWLILVMELVCEVFIRPDGYQSLLMSEKAYTPSTAQFISRFHLCGEAMALITFVPEFVCLLSAKYECGDRPGFSLMNALFSEVLGPTRVATFYGRCFLALVRFRVFGLVRHWKKMWIHNTFVTMRGTGVKKLVAPYKGAPPPTKADPMQEEEKDRGLTNASNIGTALMVINSHRALIILWAIVGFFPLVGTIAVNGGANLVSTKMVDHLQAINLLVDEVGNEADCEYLTESVYAWSAGVTAGNKAKEEDDEIVPYLLYLWLEPKRCPFGNSTKDELITSYYCSALLSIENLTQSQQRIIDAYCVVWTDANRNITDEELASRANIRTGAIQDVVVSTVATLTNENGTVRPANYTAEAKYNQTITIRTAAFASFILQMCLLICVLGGLTVLRRDAIVLVLGPLRRMLKIVARYAKNPLAHAATSKKGDANDSDDDSDMGGVASKKDELGNFETTQLINAITKIADLLRKCWGVAGADIISTNLSSQEGALTEVFNPTVPGKSVYALFGFAAIDGFSHTVHNLGGDVMILINDVATVLHGEVFRWGFGDSGQCNKNLGGAFLMVYRIGLVKEVIKKLEEATDVVFAGSTQKGGVRRRRKVSRAGSSGSQDSRSGATRRTTSTVRAASTKAMSLNLQSLPGISTFTDRAVIGMLKSFAGIYRDEKLLAWKEDFRLGAGVGAFSVNMHFGLDAGWAVEGAVGSEYKIDATYLSPHVNMASRMMSACKQYGVSILLSQAVQELMSNTACSKLRHLDTITVKGSTLKQKIYTYDARHKGVDFFLFSRSDEQADIDAERYSPRIWEMDQDLRAMRQHVTEDFLDEFTKGRDLYLQGHWPEAIKHLERADEIMVENVVDLGYIQEELDEIRNRIMDGEEQAEEDLRNATGDGPSRCLINFMKSQGGVAPEDWKGYRPLLQK